MIDMVRWMLTVVLVALLAGCGADTRDTRGMIGNDTTPTAPSGTNGEAPPSTTRSDDTRGVVLFLGTSLTAGYGLGAEQAFPALIQQKIDSAGLPFRVVNAGLSGETSAGGLRRLDWSLQKPIEVLVLELGANDGLRGLDVDDMRANLDSILTRTSAKYPRAALIIAGMEAPPNLGPAYTSEFRAAFRELAEKHDAQLLPFLLEGVGGEHRLNQADGIHPNADGHRVIAAHLWMVLGRALRGRRE